MDNSLWISPYTLLTAQPDAQCPTTAALLMWYRQVAPADRDVQCYVFWHQQTWVDEDTSQDNLPPHPIGMTTGN